MARQRIMAALKSTLSKRRVQFSLDAPNATSVIIAGDFNDWQTRRPLKRNPQGRWTARISLAPGSYQYRFLVDGVWCDDPRCSDRVDNRLGGQNCVRVVK